MFVLSGLGVRISGLINQARISVLLDTGATSNILNEETWKKSGNNRSAKLHKMKLTPDLANGEVSAIQGSKDQQYPYASEILNFKLMLIVRDIPHARILGSDLLEQETCRILIWEPLWLRGKSCRSFIRRRHRAFTVSSFQNKLSSNQEQG